MVRLTLTLSLVFLIGACKTTPSGLSGQAGFGAEFGVGPDAVGSLITVEAEFPVGDKISVAGRFLSYDYSFDDGDTEEDGDGRGLGGEFRFYPQEALKGFYVGAGAGFFFDASYETRNSLGFVTETGDSSTFAPYGAVGYTFRFGKTFALTPTFIIGTYVSDSPESGPFAGLGLRATFGW